MRTRIIIQNLKCGGCAKTITSRLNQEADVNRIEVLLDDGAIVVEHESAHTPIEVKQILKQLGYPSVEEENGILTKARSVVSCATGKVRS